MSTFSKTQELAKQCSGFFNLPTLSSAQQCPGVGSCAIIQAEGDNLRYRMDGVAPTSSTGALLLENTSVQINGDLSQLYIIETTGGGSANIHVFK